MTKTTPPKDAVRKTRRLDWEAIERDFRTGQFSLRELEAKHGAGFAAISRRAKRDGWTQDLREVVRAATSAALIREVATEKTTEEQQSTKAVVLGVAEVNKQVILRHRSDIAATRCLAMELLAELRLATHSQGELTELMRMASEGLGQEDIAAVRQALNDLVKVHARVGSVSKLADALKKLQDLERTAFDLNDPGMKPPARPDAVPWGSIPAEAAQNAYMAMIGA